MTIRMTVAILAALGAAAPLAAGGRPDIAPAGTADTRYCMRVEAVTGTLIEPVKCWTRAEWSEKGVDVDKDWRREGVRIIG